MFSNHIIGSSLTSRLVLILVGATAIGMSLACCMLEAFVRYIVLGFLALAIVALVFVLFVSKPRWGVALVILEAVLGGNGHWFDFPGTFITPRYVLIPMVVLGYFVHKMMKRDFNLPRVVLFSPLAFFGIFVAGSILQGLISGNAEPFQEPQVWLYLLLYPIIVDLWRRDGIPINILRILIWSTVAMALFQLILSLVISLDPEMYDPIYSNTPLEAMRIITSRLYGTVHYVFWGNSALCGVVLAFSLLLIGTQRIQTGIISRAAAWKIVIIMCLAMVFSMTRGTWGQLVLTILFVGFDFVMNRKMPLRFVVVAVVIMLGFVWIFLALPEVREAFEARFGTLTAEKYALDPDDSLIVKNIEQNQLCAAIAARPFFGFGFGVGDYGEFGYRLIDTLRFHNYFLGFALKTGLIGLASLLFLLFSGCLWAMRVGYMVRHSFPEQRALLFGMAYSFAGIFLATTSNPHLGVPAVIATFALMLAVSDLAFNEWKKLKENEA